MSEEEKKQNESLTKKRPDYSPQRMKQISAAAYQIFMNAPDEKGNPQDKYQQFALGALQGFQDIGRAGTEQELKYILLRMKEWYKDKETYDKQFQQQIEDLQKSELNCFFILYTGRKNIFKKRRKRKRRKKTLNEIINPNTVSNTPIEEKPKNAETTKPVPKPAPESPDQAKPPKTSSATVTAKQTVSTAKKPKSNYQPFQAPANTYHYGSKQNKKSPAFSSPVFSSVSEEKNMPEEATNKTSNTEPSKKQVHDFFFSEEPEFESLEPPAE